MKDYLANEVRNVTVLGHSGGRGGFLSMVSNAVNAYLHLNNSL